MDGAVVAIFTGPLPLIETAGYADPLGFPQPHDVIDQIAEGHHVNEHAGSRPREWCTRG